MVRPISEILCAQSGGVLADWRWPCLARAFPAAVTGDNYQAAADPVGIVTAARGRSYAKVRGNGSFGSRSSRHRHLPRCAGSPLSRPPGETATVLRRAGCPRPRHRLLSLGLRLTALISYLARPGAGLVVTPAQEAVLQLHAFGPCALVLVVPAKAGTWGFESLVPGSPLARGRVRSVRTLCLHGGSPCRSQSWAP